MSLLSQKIPDADSAPPAATPSPIGERLQRAKASRRTVFRAAMGAGMAVGVSAIGVLPGARRASAGWYSTYSTHTSCSASGFSGSNCVGGSISTSNCNGRGYHRDDSLTFGCDYYDYSIKYTTCNGKNAWVWNGSGGYFRCSDGWTYYNSCGSTGGFLSICKAWL
ncbi:hypothetical protein [Salinispora arenicola]|uniref:Uncharacterized protein n=1 Tax=Salinispora arenicola TaxID=168697 RepID=A0A542XIM9_SALAC|nr:hypothetical protein [Salinispora arenicola]TQL35630.1 hypothetical protein FB564_0693 [Salinispora arenicola]GIM81775.1 hypothetical protein Sar04_03890 [Salinispora arenicola]